jgi:tetratricopeptide (TPR) repeat protein
VTEKDCEAMINKARNYESQATGTVAGQEFVEMAADKLKEAGDCYFKFKNYKAAINCYSEAREHHKKLNYAVSVAMDSEGIAQCYKSLGSKDEFTKFMGESAEIYAAQGEKLTTAGNLVSAALLYSEAAIAHKALCDSDAFRNFFDLAAQNYLEYAETLLEEKDYGYAAANLGWASMCAFAISNKDDAIKNSDRAIKICEKNNILDDNYELATLSKAICDGVLKTAKQYLSKIKDNLSESELKIVKQCLQTLE